MSVLISAAIWRMQFGDPSRKLVALALADQANDEGECWPKVSSTATRTEFSSRSIQRHLSAMIESGLLQSFPRFDGGRQVSNMYRFNLTEEGTPIAPDGTAKPAKEEKPAIPLPHGPAFAEKWAEWEKFRKQKKATLTPISHASQTKALAALTESQAIDCLDESIRNGWTGIFPKKQNGTGGGVNAGNSRRDRTLNSGSTFGAREQKREDELFE